MRTERNFDFEEFEANLFQKLTQSRRGLYAFRMGSYAMEYSLGRSDFDYEREIRSHAAYVDEYLQPHETYRVLNIGVGLGLEPKLPLEFLRDIARNRSVVYEATNLNTPPYYQDPPDEFFNGDDWHIVYSYHDQFLFERDTEISNAVHLFLTSRVVEWSAEPEKWFRNVWRVLAPGGIACIHTTPWVGTKPDYLDPVQLAKEAGFMSGFTPITFDLDPTIPILQMFLYKQKGEGEEYSEWLKRFKKQNSFSELTSVDNDRFKNLAYIHRPTLVEE